jgi:hypothetical protein
MMSEVLINSKQWVVVKRVSRGKTYMRRVCRSVINIRFVTDLEKNASECKILLHPNTNTRDHNNVITNPLS